MRRSEAQRYVLALVNRDRGRHDLAAVVWDEVAARAGEEHARDMAKHGYTAHWGTDGSVPEQRYTRVGGKDMQQENAGCFFDGRERVLDPSPTYDADALEKMEAAFYNEAPPHDGHRRNILTASHNRLGVGLAQPMGARIPCMAQEFIASYGDYAELPELAHVGETVRVSGNMDPAAEFFAVGVARIDPATSLTSLFLNATHTYSIPQPFVTYFAAPYVSPIPVQVSGSCFSVAVPLSDAGKPGLYEVSVFARLVPAQGARGAKRNSTEEPQVMVSLRTIEAR